MRGGGSDTAGVLLLGRGSSVGGSGGAAGRLRIEYAACVRSAPGKGQDHYFLAALLVPLTRFSGPVPSVSQGMLVGFSLQGVVVFGIEPLWARIPAGHANATATETSAHIGDSSW